MRRLVRPNVSRVTEPVFDLKEHTCILCGLKYLNNNTPSNKRGICKKKCPARKRTPVKTNAKYKIYKNKTDPFYETKEWLSLRFKVLETYGRKCMLCGETDAIFHVDHIKPRHRYPDLELNFNNMQVLCAPCNIGKSNKTADFRKEKHGQDK